MGGLLGFGLAAFGQSPTNEFRGFWVDAWAAELRHAAGVTKVVNDTRQANMNALVCQVRRRADSFYRNSPFEPVCTDVAKGFDPLAELLAQAHNTTNGQQRLEVHAWLVTFHAWNNRGKPSQPDHPMNLHPDWLMRNSGGKIIPSFDPGHPEVHRHTYNVALHIVTNYDVDGINFDYIRYQGCEEGYNAVSLARFQRQTGRPGKPAPQDPVWKQWRRDQITAILRKIYLNTIALKPKVKVSADTITWSPGPSNDAEWQNKSRPYRDILQDWRAWMEEGILDLNIPMTYFRERNAAQARDYLKWTQFIADHQYQRHAVIGPGLYLNGFQDSIRQMRAARVPTPSGRLAQGTCLYCYKTTSNNEQPRDALLKALVQPGELDKVTPPIFAQKATIPVMPWKESPTKGHLKGFLYGGGTTNPLDGGQVCLVGPVIRTLLTDATGFFGAVDLPPGKYNISGWMDGCGLMRTNVTIQPGVVATRDLVLPPGAAPVIVFQPQESDVKKGQHATLEPTIAGAQPLHYQWRLHGTNLPGASAPILVVSNASPENAGPYSVVVTNHAGALTSTPVRLNLK